jgi:hypothetical protein
MYLIELSHKASAKRMRQTNDGDLGAPGLRFGNQMQSHNQKSAGDDPDLFHDLADFFH